MAEPAKAIVLNRDNVARGIKEFFSPPNRQAALAGVLRDKSLSAESVTTSAVAEVIRNESLWPCTPQSIFDCVLAATQLQLRVGKDLGHAYLVPFRDKAAGTVVATFIIGYRGLVMLARRSGEIASITANVVYSNDVFEAVEGSNGRLHHAPKYFDTKGRGELVGVYAYAKLTGGGEQWAVMSIAEVDAVRARSRASGSGPWVTDYAEMAKKTVVRRLAKMLPISVDDQEAVASDEDREFNNTRDITPQRAAGDTQAARVKASLPKETATVVEDAPPHDPTTGEVAPETRAVVAEALTVAATNPAPIPTVERKPRAAKASTAEVSDPQAEKMILDDIREADGNEHGDEILKAAYAKFQAAKPRLSATQQSNIEWALSGAGFKE